VTEDSEETTTDEDEDSEDDEQWNSDDAENDELYTCVFDNCLKLRSLLFVYSALLLRTGVCPGLFAPSPGCGLCDPALS